jgi:hypothetical protein
MVASAAGRGQRVSEANHLLMTSREVAERIGGDRNDYETSFGVSQVTMQTVNVHVVTENFTAALTAADLARLPVVSRARNLYDQALAHTRLGHDQRALDAVLAAEHLAPDLMRYHALPRQIVAELLERAGTPGFVVSPDGCASSAISPFVRWDAASYPSLVDRF